MLSELDLYDATGKLVGLQTTDAGTYLVGYKSRSGSAHGEKKILLAPECLEAVNVLIATTEPIRTWLKANGDPRWRRLFLSITSMGTRPTRWRPAGEASRQGAWLASRFVKLCSMPPDAAKNLAKRFSLRRLRASAAVLVYLRTCSVQKMAEALGHAKHLPRLLDHYLPAPIQQFFVERWVRLFQAGIVCEAMKDSPYLLQASGFSTMEALRQFMEQHAIKHLPLHLESPESLQEHPALPQGSSKLVFGINVEILTLLSSISSAVSASPNSASCEAHRWARLGDKLLEHLLTQEERPEFVTMAEEAKKYADPALAEAIIYA